MSFLFFFPLCLLQFVTHFSLPTNLSYYSNQIGQTGLGKSTLINTIFASHLIDSKGRFEPDEPIRQTTEIQAISHSEFILSLPPLPCLFPRRIGEEGIMLRTNCDDVFYCFVFWFTDYFSYFISLVLVDVCLFGVDL